MGELKQYILSIVAVCICCGIVGKITGGKSGSASIINMACGIILSIAVISPAVNINIGKLDNIFEDIKSDGDLYIHEAQNSSDQALRAIISDRVCAYVLEKASSYDCNISNVEVFLTSDDIPVPESVEIVGTFSPYGKNHLSGIFELNLGIPKERQQWIYKN